MLPVTVYHAFTRFNIRETNAQKMRVIGLGSKPIFGLSIGL